MAVCRPFPVPEPVGWWQGLARAREAERFVAVRAVLRRFAVVGGVFGLDCFVMHQRQDGALVIHEFRAGQGIDVTRTFDVDIKRLLDQAGAG